MPAKWAQWGRARREQWKSWSDGGADDDSHAVQDDESKFVREERSYIVSEARRTFRANIDVGHNEAARLLRELDDRIAVAQHYGSPYPRLENVVMNPTTFARGANSGIGRRKVRHRGSAGEYGDDRNK